MEAEKLSLHKYIAVIAVLLAIVMTVLDVTIVNIALPVLVKELNISEAASVWIVTIYQLAITMLLLPMSAIGDIHSYRRVMLSGIVVFTLASAMCALSDNYTMILVSRGVQGIGGACIMSVNVALIRLIYPPKILGRGLALNAMVLAVATAAGPTIAGAILSVATWHWLFLINVPIGIAAFIVGVRHLPENPIRMDKLSFDKVSAIYNMIVFGLIFYAIGSFTKKTDFSLSISLLVIGLIFGIFYIRRELHRSSPLLPVDLLANKIYTLSIATYLSSFIAQTLAMIALPFLYLNCMGFDEMTTGLLITPWPIATMIVSPLAARISERLNPGKIAALGMLVFAIGISLLLYKSAGLTSSGIAWRMAICGIGFGLFQTPNNIVMIQSTPISRSGAAGGMQGTSRLVGQTFGSTIVTVIFSLVAGTANAVEVCLIIAIACAILAGIFSITRKKTVPTVN